MNIYHVGQLVQLPLTFKDINGTLTDPTAITLSVKDPLGNETVYTLTSTTPLIRDSVGAYHVNITVATAGVWSMHCASTGAVQTGGDSQFFVTPALA